MDAHSLLCALERSRVGDLLLDLRDGHGADLGHLAVQNLSRILVDDFLDLADVELHADCDAFARAAVDEELVGLDERDGALPRNRLELGDEEFDVNAMMNGKFTLRDMYKQLESLKKMGPLKQVMSMLPLGGIEIPQDAFDVTGKKMERYKVIMDSMTAAELDNPSIISGNRIFRISKGAGSTPEEVRELLKYYKTMQRTLKGFKGMGGSKFGMQRLMKKFGGGM